MPRSRECGGMRR